MAGWGRNRYVDSGNSTPLINDDGEGTVMVTDERRGKWGLVKSNITT